MQREFVILHVARMKNELSNGVQQIVPQHMKAQEEYAQVALLNIENMHIDGIQHQFQLASGGVENLLPPFNHPDIVVFHEVYRKEYIKIAQRLRALKIPYVIMPHGGLTKSAQAKNRCKKLLANILFFNKFIYGAEAIQCLSQAEYDDINHTTKFIGTNGMSRPDIHKEAFSKEELQMVYVGRLDVYYKGIDLLIEAVAKCKTFLKENKCKVHIYGPDKKGRKQKIEELIQENNVGEVVILHDGVFGKEKENVLLGADYFIQTSRSEGMPLGILEALSYGVPCIVTVGTRLAEVIEQYHAGWHCEVDAEEIAQIIRRAITEKEQLKEKSCHGIELVEKEFDWKIIAGETVRKYKGLVERKLMDGI